MISGSFGGGVAEEIEEQLIDAEDQLKKFVNEVRRDTEHFSDVLEGHIMTQLMSICEMASRPARPIEMRSDWISRLDARALAIEVDKLFDELPKVPL